MLEEYPDVLEVKDLQRILHIGRQTAYSLLSTGQIPFRRIGRIYKIQKAEVINFLSDKSNCKHFCEK